MYNVPMNTALDRSRPFCAMLALVLLAALLPGCGGKSGGESAGGSDYACREALAAALASESALEARARTLIVEVTSGRCDLQACLDELVTQSRQIVDQISRVSAADEPSDPSLKQARSGMEQLLRDRVFQVETALGARTPAELQSLYDAGAADLAAKRDRVRALIQQYEK